MGWWLDVGALALLLGLAWSGARRGAAEAGLRLLALFGAYGAAVLAATRLGAPAARQLGLHELLGMVLCGSAAFVLAALALGALARRVGRAERGPDGRPGGASRGLGALLGATRGAVLLLPLLWLAYLVQGLGTAGLAPELPDLSGARLPQVGGAAARVGAAVMVDPDDPAQRLTARLATEPGAAIADVQAVIDHPALTGLQADPDFWADVEDGALDRALARPSFDVAMHDAHLRGRLADLGLLDARAADDPEVFRAEMREVLAEVGVRLRALHDDPALRALMRDEDLAQRLSDGDTMALLTDPRFHQLMARVGETGPAPAP